MDVFGCGIVLYEMLTGRRLFLGKNDVDTIKNVRSAKVPDLTAQNPAISKELDAIVKKALAKKPDNRFQSCDDLAEALAHYLFSSRLKVTGFDLRRTIESLGVAPRKKRSSLIDVLIKEELSGFTSIGPAPSRQGNSALETGAKPLNITGFDTSEHNWSSAEYGTVNETSSIETNLEDMLEGSDGFNGPPLSDTGAQEFRGNFLLGLGLAIAVVGLGFAAAFILGII
jgi:serine/threonine-protein kinase